MYTLQCHKLNYSFSELTKIARDNYIARVLNLFKPYISEHHF